MQWKKDIRLVEEHRPSTIELSKQQIKVEVSYVMMRMRPFMKEIPMDLRPWDVVRCRSKFVLG